MTRKIFHIGITFLLLLTTVNSFARKKEIPKRTATSYGSTLPKPDTLASKSKMLALAKAPREAAPARGGRNLLRFRTGIDISHYQGQINWDDLVSDDQVGFVYIKATEGSRLIDNTFQTNLNEAKRVGIKVGCYHFFSPTMDPTEQFNSFAANYDAQQMDLIPFIDVEKIGSNSKEQFCERLDTFLNLFVKRYGFRPLIYAPLSLYNKVLSGHYNDYKFMIAKYKAEDPVLADGRPYILWQFTERGKVKGISGHVDQSRFHDTADLYDILL